MRVDLARVTFFATMCFFLLLGTTLARSAERRVALVVGASAYRAVPPLKNTLHDASGIAAALKRLDFDVDTVLDPDRAHFEVAVRRFGERARAADVAFFYYAGHAVEANGHNWLLPISANPHDGRDLRFEAVDLDGVLEQLDGAARFSVIILDSCRDNPFRIQLAEAGRGINPGGLAEVHAAVGTLVVFSTAPGTVAADGTGPNSPFTGALLRHIETPGVEIRELIADVRHDVREATRGQQVPWEQSAMEGALFLKPSLVAPATPSPRGPEAETLFWDSVRDSADPNELNAYLAHFPNGIFATLARGRIAALASPPPPTPEPSPAERLLRDMPAVPRKAREQLVRDYLAAEHSKAMAISIETGDSEWSANWPDGDAAMQVALEGCQIRTGKPCAPFAIDADLQPHSPAGEWPRRDMPRVHYAGPYDPTQIPRLRDSVRASAAVTGYAAAPRPKAMAFHTRGLVFVAAGAASDIAAQELALAACNADPDRQGQGGPCFLYATDNQVVLPKRLTRTTTGSESSRAEHRNRKAECPRGTTPSIFGCLH